MHVTSGKDTVLKLKTPSHLIADIFSGLFFCFGAVACFFAFASILQLFKPSTIGEVVKGFVGLLLVFSFASTWLLVGLRYLCGPEGVKIDVDQKTVCVWRRNFWLKTTKSFFPFEQLKQIKIEVRQKPGKFSPGFNMFSVLAGDKPNEVELDYFSNVSDAKILAKRVADFSGLRFVE